MTAASADHRQLPPQIEVHDRWLRLAFADRDLDFHHLWLRHNSDGDRHPDTGEKVLCPSDIPFDVRPLSTSIDDDTLTIAWSDGSTARYAHQWLRAHAYAIDRHHDDAPSSRLERIEIAANAADVDDTVARALQIVDRFGAVVVRAAPGTTTEQAITQTEPVVQAFERRGLPIVATHFGRIEDLRPDNTTNANTDQLGYTNAGIEPHTDQPFLDRPPRYQLLQGIVRAVDGGESFVVDAEAAARHLQSTDRRAYELLTRVKVRFHRKQKAFERIVDAPIITPGGRRGFQVRFSYFTMAPLRLDFDEMEDWYRAYATFERLVRSPQHQYRFHLNAGDVVLYDNLRMLHGRTPFAGARWVRGIYFDDVVLPATTTTTTTTTNNEAR